MDGISGTITKPYKGAKEGGWVGFSKGLAKGAAGLVTGPGAGKPSSRFYLLNNSARHFRRIETNVV